MPLILSGLVAREGLKKPLIARIKALQKKRGMPLVLAIVQVGDRADSTAYINAKKKFGEEVGIEVRSIKFKESASQAEILSEIKKLNEDASVAGIIVQLPLPKGLDERTVIDVIDPKKDADAIVSTNIGKWPATARGIGELLDFYKIPFKGKKVCVIGRSPFVGAPIAAICRARGALVTVCHSKTTDLVKETVAADVIISAVGHAGLITAEHVRSGQVVVDVGLSRADGGLVGDVDFERVKAILGDKGAITPVPGGVGPMTVLALFENLIDCATL